ncbi:hypothetical protein COU58_03140 [Candidatus Pacearchaeota archaeon CG10_big_fil_rev_8_21_14_0_10_32_42]|nr:MAG: hypothetical protein COU58_03140 [Candidatus Pacearchaeota archaeon CG10_big_fil_rev_8_21_14_0_10_32_42]
MSGKFGLKNAMKFGGVFLVLIFYIFFISLVVADVISVNSGGGNNSIITPGANLEGFFFQSNRIPVVTNVLLVSSSGNNLTNDNLTVSYSSTDADGDFITNITDWRLDGTSIAVLNMPFDKNVAELTAGAVRDYSTYGNNGTLGGGTKTYSPTWNSSCQVGGCYEFDGIDDYVSLISSSGFVSPIGTISYWMKLKNNDQIHGIYHFYEVSTQDYIRTYVSASNVMDLVIEDNDVAYVSVSYDLDNLPSYIGEWINVAWVQNGTRIYLYINGIEKSLSGTNSGSWWTSHLTLNNLHLGKTGWAPLNGSLDEFQVFNRALTPEQIKSKYQEELAGHQVEKIVSQETGKGNSWRVAVTPNDRIIDGVTVLSNILEIVDSQPDNPTNVELISLNGRNESDTDLQCSAFINDADNSELDVYINWFKDDVSILNRTFGSQSNGTTFSTLLNSGNLTLGDIWVCSVRTYDGNEYSGWEDSNNLTIIDITAPNVSIISPNSSISYTTLEIDFNISVTDNENISMCFYSLDWDTNISMDEVNDSYFWYESSLGPGTHYLEYYCNDTSNNWGMNATNFTIDNSAAISILLSDELEVGVKWNVVSLPVDDLDALGNNGSGATYYFINISATNTLVDLYVRADGDLYTESLDILGLGNETYSANTTDPTVSNSQVLTMTTNYVLIGDALGDNSVIYLKFYLDAPSTQAAGTYLNQLQFNAVRDGEIPE